MHGLHVDHCYGLWHISPWQYFNYYHSHDSLMQPPTVIYQYLIVISYTIIMRIGLPNTIKRHFWLNFINFMRVKHWSHKFFYPTICYNAWNTRAHKLHKFVERPVLVNSHNFFSSSTKWSSLHRSRQLVVDRPNLHTTNQLLHGLKCHTTVITPCTYAKSKVIGRVVVVIVVVIIVILDTKIAKSGDLHVGTWASC